MRMPTGSEIDRRSAVAKWMVPFLFLLAITLLILVLSPQPANAALRPEVGRIEITNKAGDTGHTLTIKFIKDKKVLFTIKIKIPAKETPSRQAVRIASILKKRKLPDGTENPFNKAGFKIKRVANKGIVIITHKKKDQVDKIEPTAPAGTSSEYKGDVVSLSQSGENGATAVCVLPAGRVVPGVSTQCSIFRTNSEIDFVEDGATGVDLLDGIVVTGFSLVGPEQIDVVVTPDADHPENHVVGAVTTPSDVPGEADEIVTLFRVLVSVSPVGGITELFVGDSDAPSASAGSSGDATLPIAAAAGGLLVALAGGGLFVRRRLVR